MAIILKTLKSLLPEFEGKINFIYIDPPYNTGNEDWANGLQHGFGINTLFDGKVLEGQWINGVFQG